MNYTARLKPDRTAIFLFHGVIERQTHEVRNYTRKHLTRDYFTAALHSLLDAGGHPTAMDDVLAAHKANEPLPPKSFVVTFDDGFENNYSIAAPILAGLNIPATFYVTSSFIEYNRMSWIDRIELVVERYSIGGIHQKIARLDEIRTKVKSDSSIDPDDFASTIQQELCSYTTWSSDDPLDLKMSWDQVRKLASNPLFAVGGHTHTHAILSYLGPAELEREINLPLKMLETRAGIATHHFSYPEGLEHCYSEAVIERLKVAGIEICPTAEDGDNSHHDCLFHLKRIMAL